MHYFENADPADLFDPDNAGEWEEEYGLDPYDVWEEHQQQLEQAGWDGEK